MKYTDWLIPRLRNLEHVRYSIQSMENRITILKSQFGALRSATTDSIPTHGGTSSREDAMICNIAERQELERNIRFARAEVKEIDDAMSQLPADDRTVLQKFYVRRARCSADTLAEELHCDRSTVYRIRDRALVELARMLYGRVEL